MNFRNTKSNIKYLPENILKLLNVCICKIIFITGGKKCVDNYNKLCNWIISKFKTPYDDVMVKPHRKFFKIKMWFYMKKKKGYPFLDNE